MLGNQGPGKGEVLREECRLPFGVIQRYLKWRYGLGLSLGKLVGLVRGAAVGNFLCGLSIRKDEVKGRCRTVLQSKAEGFLRESQPNHRCIVNAHPTLALV